LSGKRQLHAATQTILRLFNAFLMGYGHLALNTHCTHLVPTRDYCTHTSLVLERLLPRILGAPARGNDGSQEQGQGYGAFHPCPAASVPHQPSQTLAKKSGARPRVQGIQTHVLPLLSRTSRRKHWQKSEIMKSRLQTKGSS